MTAPRQPISAWDTPALLADWRRVNEAIRRFDVRMRVIAMTGKAAGEDEPGEIDRSLMGLGAKSHALYMELLRRAGAGDEGARSGIGDYFLGL